MINYIIMICFPAFVGLCILYKHKKQDLKIAIKYYLVLFYVSNLISSFIVFKILKQSFSQELVFFLVNLILSTVVSILAAKVIILNKNKFKFKFEKSNDKTAKSIKIVAAIILVLSAITLGALAYYKKYFSYASFEILFFALINNVTGTSDAVITAVVVYIFVFLIIYCIIAYTFIFPHKYNLYLKTNEKKFQVIPFAFFSKKLIKGNIILLLISLLFSLYVLDVRGFASSILKPGSLYENHYVDPLELEIKFPEKKKNLVLIFLESMESSLFSKAGGGAYQSSIIPELEEIAIDNTSFRPDEKLLSGIYVAPGCNWTAAAMVCQSSGVNLSYGFSAKKSSERFLPGVHSLGKILEKENYNLEIIMGSDGSFNNRNLYYKLHGNYKVLDLFEAAKLGYLPQDYRNDWWGFEDSKLYEISKKELTRLAAEDKAFAYTMLTVDTHFPGGYLDDACKNSHEDSYLSSFACASSMLNDFIKWMQQQDFYDDTVVVITGDHLIMQDRMFNLLDYKDRYIYNTIINSSKKASTTIRQGSSFDVFPTVLSSMGAEIQGDRLGLGTDLFSQTPTLLEELGRVKFEQETRSLSKFYIDNLVKEKKVD